MLPTLLKDRTNDTTSFHIMACFIRSSAKDAKHDSPRQARATRDASPLVSGNNRKRALKVRTPVITLFRASCSSCLYPGGDAPRVARRLPLAIIFRAFGAARLHSDSRKVWLSSNSER